MSSEIVVELDRSEENIPETVSRSAEKKSKDIGNQNGDDDDVIIQSHFPREDYRRTVQEKHEKSFRKGQMSLEAMLDLMQGKADLARERLTRMHEILLKHEDFVFHVKKIKLVF